MRIIVPDSSSLYALDAPVPPQQKTAAASAKRYVDLLRLMASQGDRVLIPEMVAYECARMTSGGDASKPYFSKNPGTLYVYDFLSDVRNGRVPNARIVPVVSDTPQSHFIRDVKQIVNANVSAVAKRQALKALRTPPQHGGEMACMELIARELCQHPGAHVHFMCEDNDAVAKHIAAFKQEVAPLNAAGLIRAATLSGMHERIGLASAESPEASFVMHNNIVRNYADRLPGSRHKHTDMIVDGERFALGGSPHHTPALQYLQQCEEAKLVDNLKEFQQKFNTRIQPRPHLAAKDASKGQIKR